MTNGGVLRRAHAAIERSPFLDQTTRSGWGVVQRLLRPRKLAGYLSSTDKVRVLLGAGPHGHPGWISTDITPSRRDVVFVDATKPLPFRSGTVDLVYTEHMIEHVPFESGQALLHEIARVLAPSGRVRVSTPDYHRVLALETVQDPAVVDLMVAANDRHGQSPGPIFAVNRLFSGHGHRFLWSESLLREELEAAGLTEVTRHEPGDSDTPDLAGMEQHANRIPTAWNTYQSLILEATCSRGRASGP